MPISHKFGQFYYLYNISREWGREETCAICFSKYTQKYNGTYIQENLIHNEWGALRCQLHLETWHLSQNAPPQGRLRNLRDNQSKVGNTLRVMMSEPWTFWKPPSVRQMQKWPHLTSSHTSSFAMGWDSFPARHGVHSASPKSVLRLQCILINRTEQKWQGTASGLRPQWVQQPLCSQLGSCHQCHQLFTCSLLDGEAPSVWEPQGTPQQTPQQQGQCQRDILSFRRRGANKYSV